MAEENPKLSKDEIKELLEKKVRKVSLLGKTTSVPITPTTLKWEKMVNDFQLQQMQEQAGLPRNILGQTYLLSPEYFRGVVEERNYPYSTPYPFPGDFPFPQEHLSGFAPYPGLIPSFFGGTRLGGLLNKAIVLQKGSEADIEGYLPGVLRHEYKHKYLPESTPKILRGLRLPEGLKTFLSRYSPEQRGEELAAEIYAGRGDMPPKLYKELKRRMIKEWGYKPK